MSLPEKPKPNYVVRTAIYKNKKRSSHIDSMPMPYRMAEEIAHTLRVQWSRKKLPEGEFVSVDLFEHGKEGS